MESTILGSRYELLERVGIGGMAVVYKAKDIMLNRFVAVKILREEYKENEDFIRRFKIESQAAASLSHQNIVQIYDVGEENGMHYIVMEFLEGDTLKQHILNNKKQLSLREAINFSMQICRALEHAHSKYVVHRDIKPQNMVITESGKLKVTDFGIARAANNTTTVNDKSAMAVGSAHYLSPEQARGGYTDHRSDIYSLGIVMYELFCGRLPFDAEESVSVLMQHLHEEPVPPREINPDLPPGIEAIILKAIKKEQRLRYKNATEILEDLVTVYQNPSVDVNHLNASVSEDGEAPSRSEEVPRPVRNTQPRKKRKKKKGISKSLIIVLSLLVFATALLTIALRPIISIFFTGTGEEVEVPEIVGEMYEDALDIVDRASTDNVKFTIELKNKEYSEETPGTIISQTPDGGGHVKSDRTIEVVVSKGPAVITLEDYSEMEYEKVKKNLEDLGIEVIKEDVTDPIGKEGYIHKQNPKEGTTLAKGESVTFYVYAVTENVIVPNVVKMDKEKAIILLTERGLSVGTISDDDTSALPVDQISYQSISANSRVPANSKINLKVSTGKNQTEQEPENETPEQDSPVTPPPVQKKTFSVKLSGLPKDKETVRIKLVHEGKTYYEKDFPTSTGNATVSIESDKSLSLDVYYDGVYITTKEVKY